MYTGTLLNFKIILTDGDCNFMTPRDMRQIFISNVFLSLRKFSCVVWKVALPLYRFLHLRFNVMWRTILQNLILSIVKLSHANSRFIAPFSVVDCQAKIFETGTFRHNVIQYNKPQYSDYESLTLSRLSSRS